MKEVSYSYAWALEVLAAQSSSLYCDTSTIFHLSQKQMWAKNVGTVSGKVTLSGCYLRLGMLSCHYVKLKDIITFLIVVNGELISALNDEIMESYFSIHS